MDSQEPETEPPPTGQPSDGQDAVSRIAEQVKDRFGEHAEGYAAARADVADKIGAPDRSDLWERVEERIEAERGDDAS